MQDPQKPQDGSLSLVGLLGSVALARGALTLSLLPGCSSTPEGCPPSWSSPPPREGRAHPLPKGDPVCEGGTQRRQGPRAHRAEPMGVKVRKEAADLSKAWGEDEEFTGQAQSHTLMHVHAHTDADGMPTAHTRAYKCTSHIHTYTHTHAQYTLKHTRH